MRQVVLDTETTGLEVNQGHRIIEIGCVELVNRRLTGRHFHKYIKPERDIDAGALAVHGITSEFLADKPTFDRVVEEFLAFIDGAELIIHNAPFDVGFIDAELQRLDPRAAPDRNLVLDYRFAGACRSRHPGQRNSLDALCQRYGVDNASRTLHGALLDAEILADVFLAMTGGQTSLGLHEQGGDAGQGVGQGSGIRRLPQGRQPLTVITATAEERQRLRRASMPLPSTAAAVLWQVADRLRSVVTPSPGNS